MTAFAEPRNSLGSMCNPERRSSRYLSNAPSRNCSCIAAAPKDSFYGDIVTVRSLRRRPRFGAPAPKSGMESTLRSRWRQGNSTEAWNLKRTFESAVRWIKSHWESPNRLQSTSRYITSRVRAWAFRPHRGTRKWLSAIIGATYWCREGESNPKGRSPADFEYTEGFCSVWKILYSIPFFNGLQTGRVESF